MALGFVTGKALAHRLKRNGFSKEQVSLLGEVDRVNFEVWTRLLTLSGKKLVAEIEEVFGMKPKTLRK